MTKFNQSLIDKARKGEIAILNDGSVEELREVLKEIWPHDDVTADGKSHYYYQHPQIGKYWCKGKVSPIPAHSVKDFFMPDTKDNELGEVLPKLEFIIYTEQTVQVSEDSWRRQRRTLNVNEDITLREIWRWVNEQNVDKNSLSIHKLEKINP